MSNALKYLYVIVTSLVIGGFLGLLLILSFDALEYEITGECTDCVLMSFSATE